MKLKPREKKTIAVGASLLILILLYHFAGIPLLDNWHQVNKKISTLETNLVKVRKLKSNPSLAQYSQSTIENQTASTARILANIEKWATDAGVAISAVRPGTSLNKGAFSEMTFDAEFNGSLESVMKFIQQAEAPAQMTRVNKLRLASNREESVMIATVTLSTLVLTEAPTAARRTKTVQEVE